MSMLSAQCYELRKCADALQDAIDSLSLGRVTYDGLTDALHYGINDLRSAANVIWELRNKMSDMVDQRLEVDRLKAETAKLRAERDEWHRVAVSKQDIIDHMRDARAENAKLWELVSCLLTCASDTGDCDRCPLNGGTGDWKSEDFCDGLLDCLREVGIEV